MCCAVDVFYVCMYGVSPAFSAAISQETYHKQTNALTYETIGNVIRIVNIRAELEHNGREFARLQQTLHHFSIILNTQDLQLGQLLRLLATLLCLVRCCTLRLIPNRIITPRSESLYNIQLSQHFITST